MLHRWPARGGGKKKRRENKKKGGGPRHDDLYKGRSRCPGQRWSLLFGDPSCLPKLRLALPSSPKGTKNPDLGYLSASSASSPPAAAGDTVLEDTGLFLAFPEGNAGRGCVHVAIGCGLLSLCAAWDVHFAQKGLRHRRVPGDGGKGTGR